MAAIFNRFKVLGYIQIHLQRVNKILVFSVHCLEKENVLIYFTFHTLLKPKRALSQFLSDLYVCLSICPSVTLAGHGKPRAPLMTTSLLYMHETVIGYELLGTGIHILKIKWRSLKICFRAFMDYFCALLTGNKSTVFDRTFFLRSIIHA